MLKNDIKPIAFGTKAETLVALQKHLQQATILPLYYFTVADWQRNAQQVLADLNTLSWFSDGLCQGLVVRSSEQGEDSLTASMAGYYVSLVNVQTKAGFISAVNEVIQSYESKIDQHQILIQPYLANVVASGVAFGRDPNTGGPYYVINYDSNSSDTTSITAGHTNQRCYYQHHAALVFSTHPVIKKVVALLQELTNYFASDHLDIEFALDATNHLYLFQARPLIIHPSTIDTESHRLIMQRIASSITLGLKQHPYLFGRQTVYGVMPDWNPAEIIGVRPKPLALSLYRELVTNAVWAYQRDNYGYANLRSFPLLVDFEGLPYIDVRVSFNSFLPKALPPALAEKLVNYYLERLIENPTLHDKVEFDIIFSCYTLDLKTRLKILEHYGFDADEQQAIFEAVTALTNQIIDNHQGLWRKDLEKIEELKKRQSLINQSNLDDLSKMYWMLEDCKRYGTLPFAGLARAGFIAIQILKSFVQVGIITQVEYANFLSTVNSVSSTMNKEFSSFTREQFLQKYGHLRPGTYDILSARYDEAPDLYFDWQNTSHQTHITSTVPFALTIQQLRQIQCHLDRDKLQVNVLELLEFIKIAIESREYAKFVFSKSVSDFLQAFNHYAGQYHITREACAYANVNVINSLYSSSINPAECIKQSIAAGKKQYAITTKVNLPPLITAEHQAWSFELPETAPNFITQQTATGPVAFTDTHKETLKGAILFIPSADPGYDWIFSHQIAGFITQFGGVNSHMAIRAGELAIPAVIGAGQIAYEKWCKAKRIMLDAGNKQVIML